MVPPEAEGRAQELLCALLELDPPDRARYLDEARVEDSLREDVESLLAAYEEAGAFLVDLLSPTNTVEYTPPRESTPSSPLEPHADPEGNEFGHYEILSSLGQGGQGHVYRARDTRLGREVALKVLSLPFVTAAGAVERFRREAETASRLDHPGICTVYETGNVRGVPYIAMRYIEGRALADGIADARTSAGPGRSTTVSIPTGRDSNSPGEDSTTRGQVRDVLHFIEGAARALHSAHEAGLVHRDIKPGNIMVTPSGDPVILDFGLVQELDGDQPTLTRTGDLMGTPHYMSPEQLAADRIPIDRTTDVYSLGVTLYESLTLQRPFDAVTREGLYLRILTAEPASPRSLNPQISRDLAIVMETALERNRERRYETALAFAEDLRRVQEHEPILARPAGPMLRLARWSQRNPFLATAATGLILLLAGGLLLQAEHIRDLSTEVLIHKSQAHGEANPLLGLNLALEAATADPENLDARQRLLEAYYEQREVVRFDVGHELVKEAIFSPDGSKVLTRALHDPSASEPQTSRDELQLWDVGSGELLETMPHSSLVHFMCFAPEEPLILAACQDGTATLWNFDGDVHRQFSHRPESTDADSGPVDLRHGAFSPDGRWLLTGSADKTARLWGIEDGTCEVFRGGEGLDCMAFSPDSRVVAMAHSDGTVRLWSLTEAGWVLSKEERQHRGRVRRMLISPDGERLVTYQGGWRNHDIRGTKSEVILWHVPEMTFQRLDLDPGSIAPVVHEILFFPDGRFLTVDGLGRLKLWNRDGQFVRAIHTDTVMLYDSASRSASGQLVAAATEERGIDVFTIEGARVAKLRGHRNKVNSVVFHPERDDRLLTAGGDGTARIWNPLSDTVQLPTRGVARDVRVARDGSERVVIANYAGTVSILDAMGDLLSEFTAPNDRTEDVPDNVYVLADLHGDHVLTVGYEIQLWQEIGPGRWEKRWAKPCRGIYACAFSWGGDRVIGVERPDGPRIYDLNGDFVASLEAPLDSVFAFSPDDKFVASASPRDPNWTARIWTATGSAAGELKQELKHENGAVQDVVFSLDGEFVLTACHDGNAYIWSRASETVTRKLEGHDGSLLVARFSHDDQRIVTSSVDGTTRLWDRQGKCLLIYPETAYWLTFSPDDKYVIYVSPDGAVKRWITEPEALIDLAKQRSIRELSAEERKRFDLSR